MNAGSIEDVKPEEDRTKRHMRLIGNALAIVKEIDTTDKVLAGHQLDAEQALRKAKLHLRRK